VAIFGNGVNGADNKAHLYIVDIKTGALVRDITAGNGTPNGLSTPLAADRDGDGTVDTVYAGDMLGNLWKFDLSGTWPNSVSTPLFKAASGQPIFARPNALLAPNNAGVLVIFGTGKFFEKEKDGFGNDDLNDKTVQSFYGVLDDGNMNVTRDDLVEQTISRASAGVGTYEGSELRYVSNNPVDYATHRGFYIDLKVGNKAEGERVTFQPTVLMDYIIFSTLVPDTTPENPCDASTTSGWVYQVTLSGGQPDEAVFDLSNDGVLDYEDNIGGTSSNKGNTVSGVKITNPGFSMVIGENTGSGITGVHIFTSSSEKLTGGVPSAAGHGRESWLQLKGR